MKRLMLMVVLFLLVTVSNNLALTSGDYTYTINAMGQATITDFNSAYSGALSIPDTLGGCPVTRIGSNAFALCSAVSVKIPLGVVSIGDWAFYRCTVLQSVTIPNTVSHIGDFAFISCDELASITIPDSVKDIGDYAFEYCPSLISVRIGNGVTSIGKQAFMSNINLKSVTIGNSVSSIGDRAFYFCRSLNEVNFKGNAPSIMGLDVFGSVTNAIIFYLWGTSGWTNPWEGRPTALWQDGSAIRFTGSSVQVADGTGKVRVSYQLNLSSGILASVSVSFSSNGGSSWDIMPQGGTITGDSGNGIGTGSHSIEWNAPVQLSSSTYNNNYRARLVATAGGVTITNISTSFTIDLRGLQGGLAVSGKVLDSNTRQGLSGANVSLAGQNTTTSIGGNYSFANVVLSSGNTITASKSGYMNSSQIVIVPAGATAVTAQDILLQAVTAGNTNKPIVSSIRSEHDVLFIAGVSINNNFTATVNWQGATPSKVHFSWNSLAGQQVRHVSTAGSYATVLLDIGNEFHGSFNRADRIITVQAETSEGIMSEPFSVTVAVIPLPVMLGGITPKNFVEQGSQKIEWTVQVPPDFPDKLVAHIPLIGDHAGSRLHILQIKV